MSSMTVRVPFVATSTCPGRSLTGYSRRTRDPWPRSDNHHSTGEGGVRPWLQIVRATDVNVAVAENGLCRASPEVWMPVTCVSCTCGCAGRPQRDGVRASSDLLESPANATRRDG